MGSNSNRTNLKRAAVLAALWCLSGTALGANLFASGQQAQELCRGSRDWCVGFVTGALDGWAALEAYYTGDKFCLPPELTTGQIVEGLMARFDQPAAELTEPASYVLFQQLIELHPCAEEQPG